MWKTLKTDTLIEDYHVTVKKDRVVLPDGAVIDEWNDLHKYHGIPDYENGANARIIDLGKENEL